MKIVWVLLTLGIFSLVMMAAGDNEEPVIATVPLQTVVMDINLIELPITNDAITGNSGSANWPAGSNMSFLFESGIALSGRINGNMRASWRSDNLFAREWQPGNLGTLPDDPEVKFYEVTRSDTFGSAAYIEWADAVAQGAFFQDLNGDAVYDPLVDRPDLLGDKTYWCVYNDVVDTTQQPRRFKTDPLEVEIHQSAWAYNNTTDRNLQIIYFRYRMTNRNTIDIEDAYFSIFADADIGNFEDDLAACDTSLSLGYIYNDGDDFDYGMNPPAFGIAVAQGPVVFSPGDTAYTYRGNYFQQDTLLDSKRLGLTAYMPFNKNSGPLNPPSDTTVARLYQLSGFYPDGSPIDPSMLGTGGSVSDNERYLYSGDPVSGSGWIDNTPQDRRMLVSMGPFEIAAGDTQDIILAFVVAQGTSSAVEAITALRPVAANAIDIIRNRRIITGVEPGSRNVAEQFQLGQNYPNPFNPTTVIPFTLGNSDRVIMEVFNLTGQKVSDVMDKQIPAGSYEIKFNGQNLPSGVYFYRLTVGEVSAVGKMVLMR